MQTKKFYELTRGEQARHGDEILTFIEVDGMYVHWKDQNGNIRIGNSNEYRQGDDGIYIPL